MKDLVPNQKSSTDPFEVYQDHHLVVNGELVKSIRKSFKKTQLDLATETCLSERTIRNIENGQSVRFETMELVANALGLEAKEICANPESLNGIFESKSKLEKIFLSLQEIALREDHHRMRSLMLPSSVVHSMGPTEIPWVGKYRGHSGLNDLLSISKDNVEYLRPPRFTKVMHSGNLFVIQGYDDVLIHKTQKTISCWWQHLIEFEGPYIKYVQATFDSQVSLEGFRYD